MNLCHHKKTQSSTANVMESYMLISMEAWSPYVHMSGTKLSHRPLKQSKLLDLKNQRVAK